MLEGHRRAAGTVRIVYQLKGCITGEMPFGETGQGEGGRSADERRVPEVDAVVAELAEAPAVTEQAKGSLVLVYGIPADRAFDVLTWCSQQTNTRLRTIAEQLVGGFAECEPAPDLRTRFDHLLLTAHQRTRQQG